MSDDDVLSIGGHSNLEELLGIAFLAARRANTFIALAMNAADRPEVKEVELPTSLVFSHMMPPTPEQLAHIKREYLAWTIGANLRDMTDHLAIFLDRLFEVCRYCTLKGQIVVVGDLRKEFKRFYGKSLSDKLLQLQQDFGVSSTIGKYLDTMKAARNCLTHRLGIVGPQDCAEGAKVMTLTWLAMQMQVLRPDGSVHVSDPAGSEGVMVNAGEQLQVAYVERSRDFAIGERLIFQAHEIRDIVFNVIEFARTMVAATEDHARRCGIEVKQPTPPAAS